MHTFPAALFQKSSAGFFDSLTVFPPFYNFRMRQNLWPNALAKLCGAALEPAAMLPQGPRPCRRGGLYIRPEPGASSSRPRWLRRLGRAHMQCAPTAGLAVVRSLLVQCPGGHSSFRFSLGRQMSWGWTSTRIRSAPIRRIQAQGITYTSWLGSSPKHFPGLGTSSATTRPQDVSSSRSAVYPRRQPSVTLMT